MTVGLPVCTSEGWAMNSAITVFIGSLWGLRYIPHPGAKVAAAIAAIGSFEAIPPLADSYIQCLRNNGRSDDAEKVRQKVDKHTEEIEKIKKMCHL